EGKTGEEGNKDGELKWAGLKYGEYTLVEVVPNGYEASEGFEEVDGEENAFSRVITLSSEEATEGVKTLPIENERQNGTAKIVKVDAVTGDKLAGAEFKMTNQTT